MKRIIPILIVGILLLSGLGAVAVPTNKMAIKNKLPTKLILDGPPIGILGEPYYCTILLTCEKGCNFSFYLDWGDGTSTGWLGPYLCSAEITLVHSYQECGTYTIRANAVDCNGSHYNATLNITIIDNHPPGRPKITGLYKVRPGTYNWTFKAVDPDGDDVRYYIDWSDGIKEWTSWHPSGEKVTRNHTYLFYKIFIVGACAQDIHGAVGEWGYILVEVSKSKQIINLPFLQFVEHFLWRFLILKSLS
jgi:hypothetical protein